MKREAAGPDKVASRALQSWLASYEGDAIPSEWVPGADEPERIRLAALGGLVGALIGAGPDTSLLPAFSAESLRTWVTAGPQPPEEHVLRYKELLASDLRDTALAELYASTVSSVSRRHLGTFFTAPTEVRWMVDRWTSTQPTPRTVVDVGAGVGIFTTTAATHWPQSQVWAVDINPVTLGLLALRVQSEFPIEQAGSSEPGIRLVLGDYLAWVQKTWSSLPAGRLVLGNPPYTRLQLLPHSERARLVEATNGLCGKRASLSALITAATLQLLEPDDGLCLILPAQWLESDYASGLRERLWSLRNRRIELHLLRSDLFDDAQVDAVALLVGVESTAARPFVLSVADGPEAREIDRTKDVPHRWRDLFDTPGSITTFEARTGGRLRDFGTVRRGVATGDNSFFVIANSMQAKHSIPQSVLRPLVRRLRDLPDVCTEKTLSGLDERHHLLVANKQQLAKLKRLQAYVALAKRETRERTLCQLRRDWYDLSAETFKPDVIVGPMTKDVFRFVENRAGAVITNNLYGITWHHHTSKRTRAELLAWLRSAAGQAALTDAARTQGDRLTKIEPRALNELRLPERFRPPAETLL